MTLLICELAFKSRVFRFGLWIPPERLMAGHNMVTHYCYHWNYNKKKRETLVSGQNHLKHPYYGAASLDYFRKVFESVDQCYCVLVWETQWKLSHISWIGSTFSRLQRYYKETLLLTTKFPGDPDTHLKDWVEATQWFRSLNPLESSVLTLAFWYFDSSCSFFTLCSCSREKTFIDLSLQLRQLGLIT